MLTQELVAEALAACDHNQTRAREWVRAKGIRFNNSHFKALCTPKPANIPTPPKPKGTLVAQDERRGTITAKTLVFTSAQANTLLNDNFWLSLMHYCEARGAEMHVSRFTYDKATFGSKSVKPGSEEASDTEDLWFDERIVPFISDEQKEITRDLIWCGELNILPTRIDPLSSLTNYTRQESGIIPHAKMAMRSVPTMKHLPAKFLYTTGTVTQRNYIQKIAGQVADFHHVFGALVVEVDDDGQWWVRQLNADGSGAFYDLNTQWMPTGQSQAQGVAAITHGDIHMGKADSEILEVVFGPDGVVDRLRPAEQHFHDTMDFTPRNHHNIKDPHFLHEMHVAGTDSVEGEFCDAANFLMNLAYREWSTRVIIVSNHDQAIETWLRNTAAIYDPVNVRFWHTINARCYADRERGVQPHPFRDILSEMMGPDHGCTFVLEDDSHLVLGQIECGLHGHLGPNGARGNPKNLRTAGKANTAHTHSAGIVEGVYTAGVYGKLDMGYNKGPSSWSHSLIVTYPNAKRAILTIKDGKAWR